MYRTTRKNLLDFLATRETASPAEIARALGCSAANARHHLSALLSEGVVVIAAERQTTRPGRPVQLYALAQPAARHNLDQLAAAALELLLSRTPPELRPALLNQLAGLLASETPRPGGEGFRDGQGLILSPFRPTRGEKRGILGDFGDVSHPQNPPSPHIWGGSPPLKDEGQGAREIPSRRTLTLRLSFAVQRLNEMGYHARWEAHASGPRLILGHCPYAAILPQHPLLCSLDAALLSTLVGERATQQIRLEPAASGLPYCMFQVEPGRP